jgi:hypothetical protein
MIGNFERVARFLCRDAAEQAGAGGLQGNEECVGNSFAVFQEIRIAQFSVGILRSLPRPRAGWPSISMY